MKKVLAFAGSNSSKSINHKLLAYVSSQMSDVDVALRSAAELNIPIYDIDTEENEGFPEGAQLLADQIKACDGVMISVAEHNGNVTAYFKSVFDWLSRIDRQFLAEKPVLLLSTSPGKGGAGSARAMTEKSIPHFNGRIIASQGIGGFYSLFEGGEIKDEQVRNELRTNVAAFLKTVNAETMSGKA